MQREKFIGQVRRRYIESIADKDNWNLEQGVLHNNQLVWEDPKDMDCCYMLFPRACLTISNESDWKWKSQRINDGKNGQIDVVQLTEWTRWVEVKGSFSTVKLQKETTYQVSFVVKLDHNDESMFNLPITLRLVLPNGVQQEVLQYIQEKTKCVELVAGKFCHNLDTIGNIRFSLTQSDSTWKKGIIIMGVQIRPQSSAYKDVSLRIKKNNNAFYIDEKLTSNSLSSYQAFEFPPPVQGWGGNSRCPYTALDLPPPVQGWGGNSRDDPRLPPPVQGWGGNSRDPHLPPPVQGWGGNSHCPYLAWDTVAPIERNDTIDLEAFEKLRGRKNRSDLEGYEKLKGRRNGRFVYED